MRIGRYIYDATGTLSAANIADRPYFEQLRNAPDASLVISQPLISRVTNDMVIVIARRLQDRRGNFSGIVFATLRADFFERYYQNLAIGQHVVITLLSNELTIFSSWPQLPAWRGKKIGPPQLLAGLRTNKAAGTYRSPGDFDGQPRLTAYSTIDGFPFLVTISTLESEVLAEWHDRAMIYALLGSVLLATIFALIKNWRKDYRHTEALAKKMAEAYEDKSRESRALLDSIPDPAWLLDTEGHYLAVNEAFCRYTGRPMSQIINHTVADVFSAEEAQKLRAGQLEVYAHGEPVRQLQWLFLNGKKRPFEFLRVPVYHEDGQPKGLAGVAWDVSERYEAEEHQRLITHFFDHASDAVLILDQQLCILTMNRAASAISGYQLEDLRGKRPRMLIESGSAMLETLDMAIQQYGSWRGELVVSRKDGRPLPIHCNISTIRNDQGEIINWVVFITDLSERKAAEARIESLTHVDQLTELPNRQGFTRILGDWLAQGRTGALIILSLNQLSRVNDAFGHAAGDTVLQRTSSRLRRQLHEDGVLGRVGNNQFGILIGQSTSPLATESFARKLLDGLARPISVEGSDVVTTACAGICLLGNDGNDTATLLRNADAALHHAKSAGQNSIRFFASDMNLRLAEHLRLESDLRGALGRHELVLHYQPQVDLSSGNIVGFESLLRWQHPELGLVSPMQFIPLAEESRLILPIGDWVLEEACRQNKAWQNAGIAPTVVAVNLSAVQFHNTDIVASVARALELSGLASRYLELEITESVIIEDPERIIGLMEQLKSLGVLLSIDDFGTGYSSLSYLKRFPIDKIKIDRAFVTDVTANTNDAAIVRMVLGIARELKHKVIAEGVETAEQIEFLRNHQCHEYQGFFCSPALAAEHIPALITANKAVMA